MKRIISLIMCICMMLSLVPLTVQAAGKLISSGEITLEVPKIGQKPSNTASFKGADSVEITKVEWAGNFDSNGCFQPDNAYMATIYVRAKNGYFSMMNESNRFTINGEETSVIINGIYDSDTAYFVYAILPDMVRENTDDSDEIAYTNTDKYYDRATADALNVANNRIDVIVNEDAVRALEAKGGSRNEAVIVDWFIENTYSKKDYDYVKRVLIDYPADNDIPVRKETMNNTFVIAIEELEEVWLSPQMDVEHYIELFIAWGRADNEFYSSAGLKTRDFTLVIPESAGIRGWIDTEAYSAYASDLQEGALFKIKTYKGNDVYAAFEKGIEYTTEYCPGHKFTATLQSADRVMQYPTCQQIIKYYYSCCYCGEIEYNKNHTFSYGDDYKQLDYYHSLPSGYHKYLDRVISEKNYAGTNANGDKVYLKSCIWCGCNYKDEKLNSYTEADFREQYAEFIGQPGYEYITYEWAKGELSKQWENVHLGVCLEATTKEDTGYSFAIYNNRQIQFKSSAWAESEMNWAAQLQLIDASLLGNDFTKNCTQIQFVSVAVKMVEQILKKELPAAPMGTFTDTDNIYVRKAYAAGITTGTSAAEFSPNATLTIQQMATFIYRALMYVRDNSGIRYTIYDSALGNYTDSWQIADWAKEPMAFMNALGLIKGTSDTLLSPTSNCTIEQAVAVAYRSLDADEIGWYQCVVDGEANLAGVKDTMYGMAHNGFEYIPAGGAATLKNYSAGERFWRVRAATPANIMDTAGDYDEKAAMAVIDEYTGQMLWVESEDFKPIKDLD